MYTKAVVFVKLMEDLHQLSELRVLNSEVLELDKCLTNLRGRLEGNECLYGGILVNVSWCLYGVVPQRQQHG